MIFLTLKYLTSTACEGYPGSVRPSGSFGRVFLARRGARASLEGLSWSGKAAGPFRRARRMRSWTGDNPPFVGGSYSRPRREITAADGKSAQNPSADIKTLTSDGKPAQNPSAVSSRPGDAGNSPPGFSSPGPKAPSYTRGGEGGMKCRPPSPQNLILGRIARKVGQ